MKTALIVALCAGALIPSAPSPAEARSRKLAPPTYALGSVAFKKLPKDARRALDDYRREERRTAYRCYGLSEKNFEKRIGLLAPVDYNGDGVVDYLFNSPCRPRALQPAADILMSNPLGYQVARRFDAFVDVVNGRPALLVESPCEEGSAEEEDGRACYIARIWDRSIGHFAGAQHVTISPDGSGYLVSPLERPRRAAPPAPVVATPVPPAPPSPAPLPAVEPAPAAAKPVAKPPAVAH